MNSVFFGYPVKRGGADVCLIDPFQAHVDAINARGLSMLEGATETTVELSARTSAAQVGVVADLVIVEPGAIPITTSGKIRRSGAVEKYRKNEFARLAG